MDGKLVGQKQRESEDADSGVNTLLHFFIPFGPA